MGRRWWPALVVGVVGLMSGGHRTARAQTATDAPPPGAARRVSGRVVRQGVHDVAPLANTWVTLHRVGSDTAGPMDSLRTDPTGRFTFRYQTRGAPDAVYFVSSSYDGIAYFSQPLIQPVVRGPDAEITVFDTTSQPVAIRVRGRHLIVSAPGAGGARSVVEVFELSNDSSVTLVSSAASGDRPTWHTSIPPLAQQLRVGQGDVSADAVTVVHGDFEVFAPIAPGLKQISFTYTLPPSAFPLVRQSPAGVSVMEILLEEPTARVEAPRLREVDPVAVEGRTFRRYLAQDVPVGGVTRVSVPIALGDRRALYFAIVLTAIGAAMLGALARAFTHRSRPMVPLAGVEPTG
jgi:primosomal replication protein N